MENFIIIRTPKSKRYAERINFRMKQLLPGIRCYIADKNDFHNIIESNTDIHPDNTVIHSRCAFPSARWLDRLHAYEDQGYAVINKTKTLRLTANKLKTVQLLKENGLLQPQTLIDITKTSNISEILAHVRQYFSSNEFVIKPYTSAGQGEHVYKMHVNNSEHDIREIMHSMPYDSVIIQEVIPYTSIIRVIVIGGVAMPYHFIDYKRPNEWKVSVCLNKTTMQVKLGIPADLAELAEKVQRIVGGDINFVDIFDTPYGYVVSEINTACNLYQHQQLLKRAGYQKSGIAWRIAEYLYKQFI